MKLESHLLVPKHSLVSKEERKRILTQLNVTDLDQLPLLLRDDPAIKKLKAEKGDLVRIERKSFTAGSSIYYRVVK